MATRAKCRILRVFRIFSTEQAVDARSAGFVAVHELATQRIDSREQRLAVGGLCGFECRKRTLESVEFIGIEFCIVSEVQRVAQRGELGNPRMVCAHIGVSRWPRRPSTVLLSEHGGQILRCVRGIDIAGTTSFLFSNDVEATLRHAPNERHDVFFVLQLRTQRAQLVEREGAGVELIVGGSDDGTLRPAGNGREDCNLVGRHNRLPDICFIAVAPNATRRKNRREARSVSTACLVEEVADRRGIEGVGATTRGFPSRSKESQRRHGTSVEPHRVPSTLGSHGQRHPTQ
ncbi:MAG: hypothetical protein RJB08_1418 [Actinomycetota bacterium]